MCRIDEIFRVNDAPIFPLLDQMVRGVVGGLAIESNEIAYHV